MALRFRGSGHFRQRLACATLSGRTIRIDDIRARDENPGLRDYEASLLRLLEKITNGCVVEINETGAAVRGDSLVTCLARPGTLPRLSLDPDTDSAAAPYM